MAEEPAQVEASPCIEEDQRLYCLKCSGKSLEDCNTSKNAKLGKCGKGQASINIETTQKLLTIFDHFVI